ncbi:MAG: phage integrase SAM-like domain-containing protein, partial [Bacteroidales bacterium]|nr:phage integrase SAM-like domain-containing protein [Bacteroidales bacterium]
MITTAVVFDHRGRTKKNQPGPLEIRVTVNRKPYYINTGVRVLRAEYKHGVVVDRPDSNELNERLNIVGRKVEHEINECIDKGMAVDVAEIRRRVLDVGTGGGSDFLDWVDERIEIIRPTLADGTMKHYKTLRNKLWEYGKLRRWQDVTVDGILMWDSWLHTLKKPLTKNQEKMGMKPELLGDAGVYNYHKNLKKLLYIAKKVKVIKENPYEDLKGEFKRGDKENVEYLTEDEMYAIINLEVQRGSHLDIVRDMFVMQMFTGMAYADLMKFDINDYKEVDGKWVTNADRVKSGVAFVAHLLPPVVEVLKKYGMQVPRVSNQVYNRSLKK